MSSGATLRNEWTPTRSLSAHPRGGLGCGGAVRPVDPAAAAAWGATPDETTRAYPGDELVPDPDGGATMATTLPAPPEKVWPWLVQMGGDRGGWYSWDWLDNDGKPSADRIVPEWQSLEEGQHLYRVPNGPSWWTVAVLEPNRTLVLVELRVRTTSIRGPAGLGHMDGIWGFHLRPAPGGRTRLVARTRSRRPAVAPAADRPAAGGTCALHHADPPVPQPAGSGLGTARTKSHCCRKHVQAGTGRAKPRPLADALCRQSDASNKRGRNTPQCRRRWTTVRTPSRALRQVVASEGVGG